MWYLIVSIPDLCNLITFFISSNSTANHFVDIYNSICKAIDKVKEVRALFCDISKAFDQVWHKGLLYKLQTVGITGHLLQWFTDYLNNRKQRVVLPGIFSQWSDLKAVLPQGYILGPLLFLIYINESLYATLTHPYASSLMALASIL